MKRTAGLLLVTFSAFAHDVITTKVTFDREIVRLFHTHCTRCHQPGGQAFSLMTYEEARPWAKAIGEEVLRRRMPPWGAVKGFGDFRDDQGLTAEQLELIVDWEEGGSPEGDSKDLPQATAKPTESGFSYPTDAVLITGDGKLGHSLTLGALWPREFPDGVTCQITAELPDGRIYPLIWLDDYRMKFNHPFILRTPLELPAGTVLRGMPQQGAKLGLIPEPDVPAPPPHSTPPASGETGHTE